MRTASIQELKQELQHQDAAAVRALCLRLAKFKKENKELLTYLLFEAHDEHGYIESIKALTDEEFTGLPKSSAYLTKKSLRKILRIVNKYVRYSGSKLVETVLLLHFCRQMEDRGILETKTSRLSALFRQSDPIAKIYAQQLKKAGAALEQLHEDLQYDYRKELDQLSSSK
ncbi:hypothetical protein [Sediminibacterium ginsengisoli]|uniref:Uncharacterized protein n=1 Tax=Sediminibacterium ginsengisoli TaxID=413434 RepID=A0A1T4MA13_9BACT|nr:hypothetical protein [Sediminibacterium ginsengisoli]SJZ63745.1 hypothetical protein SAMN04488132_103270 [Sediminibacterium ginsengisoli]